MSNSAVNSLKLNKLSICLEELSAYAKAFGAVSKPFSSFYELEHTDSSVLDNTLQALEGRLHSLKAISMEEDQKATLSDEIFLFNQALKQNKLKACDDVTKYFEYGDIIEIYSRDFMQLYGNLQFMKFCSYDLFTLYSKPFYELYSRAQEYNQQIKEIMDLCFSDFKKTEKFNVDAHVLKEIHQKNNKLFKVYPKWISPLIDDTGKTMACVLTNYCVEYQIEVLTGKA